jgi:hypothetical protein
VGEGPGEYRYLTALWINGDRIGVFDPRLLRATLLRTDGSLIHSCTDPFASTRPFQMHPLPDGGMVIHRSHQTADESFEQHYRQDAIILSADGDTLGFIESPRVRIGRWFDQTRGGRGYTRIYFGPYSQVVYSPRGEVMSGSSDQPLIHVHGLDGSLKQIMHFEFETEAVLPEEREQRQRTFEERIRTAPNEDLEEYYRFYRRSMEFSDPKSHWSFMLVDDAGFIWLEGHEDYLRGEEEEDIRTYRLVSPEGEYLGKVTWPVRRLALGVSNGYLLGFEEDEETGEIDYIIYRARVNVDGLAYPWQVIPADRSD